MRARDKFLDDTEDISIYHYFHLSIINGQPQQAKDILREIVRCGELEQLKDHINGMHENDANKLWKFIAESMIVTI